MAPGLRDTASSFVDYLKKERGFSEHTTAAYRRDLDQFIEYIQRKINTDDLHAGMNKQHHFFSN
jgi:site-specific recombinase XerD